MVGISLVEVYERVGKSVISVCKKAHVGWQIHFMALKNSGLVFYWYFKDSAAAKKNVKLEKGWVVPLILSIEGIGKGYLSV